MCDPALWQRHLDGLVRHVHFLNRRPSASTGTYILQFCC
jgi:hypothetical protein